MSKTKLPAIPATPTDLPSGQRSFFTAIKEIIEVWKGDRGEPLDSVVTFRDLIGGAGAVLTVSKFTGTPTIQALGSNGIAYDSTPPPDVSGLTTSGVFTDIIVTWTPPSYSNHAFTEIWRFTADTFNSKTFLGTTRSSIYVDSTGEGKTYFYWARHVSTSNIVGNFSLNGVSGTTQSSLSGNYISDATITTAKIANLAVSDAKIATLTAAKITAGTLVAGESITVGTGGNRIIIDSYGNIRTGSATGFANGSGFWFGESAGNAVFFFGNSASEFVSYNGVNLSINTPQFVLNAGDATFSGALAAASGTFVGSLSAATGTFSGSLSAATGTFSGTLDAATGTFGGQLLAGVVDLTVAVGETHVYGIFDTGATVVAPTGKTTMRVTLYGGAGGGGGGGYGGDPGTGGGGGGGGVNTVVYTQLNIIAGTSYTIIVGAGGAGGNLGANGQNGTSSLVKLTSDNSVLVSANGVFGGAKSVGSTGGSGGAGTLSTANGGSGGNGGHSVGSGGFIGGGPYGVAGTRGLGGVGNSQGKGGYGGYGGGTDNFGRAYNGTSGQKGGDGKVIVEFFNPNSVVLQTQYSNLKAQLAAQFGYVNTGGAA